MKKLIPLLLIAIAMPLQASDKVEMCKEYASLAAKVMEKRQSGVSASFLYQIASNAKNSHLEALVTDAYSVSKFRTKQYQQKAISDFYDAAMVECMKVAK